MPGNRKGTFHPHLLSAEATILQAAGADLHSTTQELLRAEPFQQRQRLIEEGISLPRSPRKPPLPPKASPGHTRTLPEHP